MREGTEVADHRNENIERVMGVERVQRWGGKRERAQTERDGE